jgi:hypothetical protein
MAVPWPATLQDVLNSDSFQFRIGSTAIRSEVEVGQANVRRRYTKSVDSYQVGIRLDGASQYNDFYNFFDVDLNGGVNTFDFTDPLTNTLTEFRFVGTPSIRSLGYNVFAVSMEWEKIP